MVKIENVLITGITGFVGSHLADYIIENHPDVKVLGMTRWRSSKENIKHLVDKNKITLVCGDLTDTNSLGAILSEHKPDVIFHLAAQSYVPYSFKVPISTLDTNVIGTANLLEEIKRLKFSLISSNYDPIVHICSSSEVYGQVKPEDVPINETNQFRPASPYAVSKVGEDMLALQYYLSWGIKTIRTRMFTHTGPRRGSVFATSTFAKQIAEIEAGKKSPVVKVGNLDSVRTFLDVGDAVRAYWTLVNKCKPGEVYNIGGNETMTVGEMLEKLLKLSTKKDEIIVEIDTERLRPSDVTLQIPDTSKFRNETGWKPEVPFDVTLLNLLNYWRNKIAK